jgi:mono/diheme cytochrome c family protein
MRGVRIATGLLTAGLLAATTAVSLAARDVNAGKTVFSKNCIACHLADGRPKLRGAPDLSSKAEQKKYNDAQFIAIIQKGTRSMPPYKNLTQPQLTDLVAYVRTLAKNP